MIKTKPKTTTFIEEASTLTPEKWAFALKQRTADYTEKVAALSDLIPAKQVTNRPGRPASGKVRVTMLLDPEIVAKFKATGKGWQARMNEALKAARP
jgi:uncharacterized protein (DUF4415 family)